MKVLGCVFNKLPSTGFYSLSACKTAIESYFRQYRPQHTPYGFLPELEIMTDPASRGKASSTA